MVHEVGTSTARSNADEVARAYTIRPLREGDEGSLLVSFPAAFGKERSLAAWRWAFRGNPAGTRVFVAEHEGSVVAQYAAWPARTWIDGAGTTFCQVVDSMVHPAHRAGLKKPGLLVRVAEAFLAAYGGRDADALFYGWPLRANWRIGERHLGYERIQSQLVLTRPCAGPMTMPEHVTRIDRFGDEARGLYERCVGEWGASTIRDARYLNWRYVDRPLEQQLRPARGADPGGDSIARPRDPSRDSSRDPSRNPSRNPSLGEGAGYVRLGVRDSSGALQGLCVARVRDFGGERVALVADWLVPRGEAAVGLALLAALDAVAQKGGATAMALMLPGWSPWFDRFQGLGFRVHPTAYDLVARSFDRRVDAAFLRGRWWYQLGDSDLV